MSAGDPCPLEPSGWCPRHRLWHRTPKLRWYATAVDPAATRMRVWWDQLAAEREQETLLEPILPNLPLPVLEHRACCCWLCPAAEDGVCLKLKRILPHRPCLIEIGIRRLESYCPEGHWSAFAPAVAAT